MENLAGWIVLAVLIAIPISGWLFYRRDASKRIPALFKSHFRPAELLNLVVSERRFPHRVRVDLQREIERIVAASGPGRFSGIPLSMYQEISISDLLAGRLRQEPPKYEDINIGDEQPIRCHKTGLWMLTEGESKYSLLLAPTFRCGDAENVKIEIAAPKEHAESCAKDIFARLEKAVNAAASYRGKILSLEDSESYLGHSCGILVHRLRQVSREQVILPQSTIDLLDRNVIQFARQRSRLTQFRQAVKKGLLFYGPPGTGKTHTIHYLMAALEGHTTLLITAEQVKFLAEYMTLARLLQPCMVVIEDVDLIGGDRTRMDSPGQQVLLNKLLNEMDGLKEDAQIIFVLTTNRPEMLEAALASRPGRVDQAIEFPLPDHEGRGKLIRLYAEGIDVSEELVEILAQRTEHVSAAFIKELMRRSAQFHLGRNGSGQIQLADAESALDEMLFSGGSLNLKLLGATNAIQTTDESRVRSLVG
jgi:AAA+ superfamily predicted ATPase